MRESITYVVEPPTADDPWYIAFSREVPEANGQGKTRQQAIRSLQGAIELIAGYRKGVTARR